MAAVFLAKHGFGKGLAVQPMTRNIVVLVDFKKRCDIEKLPQIVNAIYEPEQFPGAILHCEKPSNVSLLVFASGKVVIAGLKRSQDIAPMVENLQHTLEKIT